MYRLGRRITQHRKARGLTQHQLAQKLRISVAKLQRIEQGQSKTISPELLRNFSQHLQIDGNILLDIDAAPHPILSRIRDLPPQTKCQIRKLMREIDALFNEN